MIQYTPPDWSNCPPIFVYSMNKYFCLCLLIYFAGKNKEVENFWHLIILIYNVERASEGNYYYFCFLFVRPLRLFCLFLQLVW